MIWANRMHEKKSSCTIWIPFSPKRDRIEVRAFPILKRDSSSGFFLLELFREKKCQRLVINHLVMIHHSSAFAKCFAAVTVQTEAIEVSRATGEPACVSRPMAKTVTLKPLACYALEKLRWSKSFYMRQPTKHCPIIKIPRNQLPLNSRTEAQKAASLHFWNL